MTPKITPFIWFDSNAEQAVKFYTSIFKKSKIGKIMYYTKEMEHDSGKKAGTILTIDFTLNGQRFSAINGGSHFKLNPATSLFVTCNTTQEFNSLWNKLVQNATILMEKGKYPFSEQYGWLNDQFGLSWQLMLAKKSQTITPSLLFTQDKFGKCEEAIKYYTKIFPKSKIIRMAKYSTGEGDIPGKIKYADFQLSGAPFKAMESSANHAFTFNGAMSFVVNCKDQKEVDKYWKMSAVPAAEQCGWMTDQFGVTWQIVPEILLKLMTSKDKEKAKRVTMAMMQMKKLDVKGLERAGKGE